MNLKTTEAQLDHLYLGGTRIFNNPSVTCWPLSFRGLKEHCHRNWKPVVIIAELLNIDRRIA